MSLTVTKTGGFSAEITWEPADDTGGYLARAVESEQLAASLASLGTAPLTEREDQSAEQALSATMHTVTLARLLERRAAVQVVTLREYHGLSWRKIADTVFDNPDMQSSVRRMYESGRRHLGR